MLVKIFRNDKNVCKVMKKWDLSKDIQEMNTMITYD